MSISNANNSTAKFYDIASSNFKGESLSEEEIEMVKQLCNKNSKILDIGCGTGRHLLSLSKKGYEITGIDSSIEMLKELNLKSKRALNLIEGDFLKYEFPNNKKFDFIIMFWNTFNEICITKKSAMLLLKKCKSLLNPNGKILINSDNPENINPENFDFGTVNKFDGKRFDYNWKTIKFIKKTNTSHSKETVTLTDKYKRKEIFETNIIQRWWSLSDYIELSKELNLKIKELKIKQNDEMYILLSTD